MTTLPAHIVHIGINRHWADVYAFVSQPQNMPIWASGLASGLKPDGEDWIADGGPIGQVRVHFAPINDFGVVDHTVTMENGLIVENALRVVPNGDGAEVMFTLLHRHDMDDTVFASDTRHVEKDLQTLKALMENQKQETQMATQGADRKIGYIEFNVTDIAAAKSFYGAAFGWTFTDYGPGYCEFRDGRLTGGFAKTDAVTAKGGALVILFADDLDELQSRVETAGGTIAKPIYEFPGGRRFHFIDPAGYELAVWSDK